MRRRFIPIGIIVCVGIALSLIVFFAENTRELTRIQADFDRHALDRINTFKRAIDINFEVLKSVHSLYKSSQFVSRDEFRRFVAPALLRHKSIKALEWIPRIPHSQRKEYVQKARMEGYPDFRITELDAKGKITKTKNRLEYFPAYYVEPFQGNEANLGLDLSSQKTRLKALNKARDTGEMIVATRIKFASETGDSYGVLAFLPVYRGKTPPESVEARRERLTGFVLGSFSIKDLLEDALSFLSAAGIDLHLFDKSAAPDKRFLYSHYSRIARTDTLSRAEAKSTSDATFQLTYELPIADRTYHILCKSIPAFVESRKTLQAWGFLVAGLLFSGFLVVYLLMTFKRTIQVEKLAKDLSVEVSERKQAIEEQQKAKDHLDNIIESSLDCIIVADDKGIISRVNEAFLELVGFEEEEILGKHIMEFSITDKGAYESTIEELVQIGDEFFKDAKDMLYEKLFEDGKVTNWETYYLHKDKRIIPVEQNIAYLYDDKGEIVGSVGIIRDITERKKGEKEIKATKDFLANVIESSKDGILVVDEKGYVLSSNTALEQMSMFSKKDIAGKHASELVVDDKNTRKAILAKTAELFENGFATYEAKYKAEDGKHIDVECTSSMIKNAQGDYIAGVSIIRDISERKIFEHTLKQSEERYHDLLEFANVAIIVAEDNKITNVNRRAEEIYGYTKEELLGNSPTILTPEKYHEKHQEVLSKITNYVKSKGTVFEEEGIKKDGTLFPIEISFSLTQKENNTIIAVIRDLTEKKKSEKEIRETKEFLENLFETSTDAILVTDPQGNISMVNYAMEKTVGYSKDELIGKHTSLFTPPDERSRSYTLKNMEKLSREGKIYEHETLWQKKDGQQISVEINLSLLKDKDENIIGGVNFIRDVTKRKIMEQQLLQSEKLKSLGELSGGVAHDFNNVLAAILGRVQLLKIRLNPPTGKPEKRKSVLELKKGLEIIERASLDGAETVRRIQEFSRKRDDDKNFVPVDINELIDNALDFTRIRWKDESESKGIKIIIKKDFSPLTSTLGSSSELREVFTNLINNAIDAMPQGGEIRLESFMDDTTAVVKIGDTGKGIPEDIKDRIFDPFFTSKGVQSTGLGLSVSYGIINRHHGTITVDSAEDKGTTFTVKLPITNKTDQGNFKKEKVIPIEKKQKKSLYLGD